MVQERHWWLTLIWLTLFFLLSSTINCLNYFDLHACQVKKCMDLRRQCLENRICLFHWDKYNKLIFNGNSKFSIVSSLQYKSLFQEVINCFNSECNALQYYNVCGHKLRTLQTQLSEYKEDIEDCLLFNQELQSPDIKQDQLYCRVLCVREFLLRDLTINREIIQSFWCDANLLNA